MSRKISKNIFVVDDSKFESSLLQDYITDNTVHKVTVFGTGEECITHLVDEPDLIILDYNLNSVNAEAADGDKILTKIKQIAPTVHVVMLSSQEAYGVALKTVMHGADTYIIKDNDAFAKIVALIQEMN